MNISERLAASAMTLFILATLLGLGVAIAWVVFPFALEFLLSFGRGVFANELSATGYFNFITTMFLAFGLVMEFPILLFGLSRVGIVTSQRLRAARRALFTALCARLRV
jgi:sec-independent protein translocase protein TatC